MDSGSGLPAFDELPLVYQARIRDIQQEFMDGDITQKGYDKRMAKIVQDYQSTTTMAAVAQEGNDAPEMLGSVHRTFTTGNEGVDCDFSAMRVGSDSPSPPLPPAEGELLLPAGGMQTMPAVGSRSGGVVDSRAFYDARKSTVVGFRKPGINFDALLDDFDDDDDDGAMGLQALSKSSSSAGEVGAKGLSQFGFGGTLQAIPPVPELPEAYPVAPSIDKDRADYDDGELTSGRAYNVLSDIMDPYGSQLSRANQELYSDDSSNDGILDDLDGLSPAGISSTVVSPGYSKQQQQQQSEPSVSEARDAPTESADMEYPSRPYVNGGSTRGGGNLQHVRTDDLQRQISLQADDIHTPSDQTDMLYGDGMSLAGGAVPANGLDSVGGLESVSGQRPDMRLPVPRSSSTSGMYGVPSSVNMLTPDTPTVGQFGASNFGSSSTFTDTIRTPKQPGRARYAENMASLSPVSGIHACEDDQASSSTTTTSTTGHAATIASGVGTITLEDMAVAAASAGGSSDVAAAAHSSSRAGLPDAWVAPPPPSHTESAESARVAGFGDDDGDNDIQRRMYENEQQQQQQHLRPSIQSVAFGSFDEHSFQQVSNEFPSLSQAEEVHGFPYQISSSESMMSAAVIAAAAADGGSRHQPAIHSQASVSTASSRTPGRRPTYSTRSDRGGGVVAGRASYYAPEAQPEVPANFDMNLLPSIDPAVVAALEGAEASSVGREAAAAAAAAAEEDNRDSLADYAFEHALPYRNSGVGRSQYGGQYGGQYGSQYEGQYALGQSGEAEALREARGGGLVGYHSSPPAPVMDIFTAMDYEDVARRPDTTGAIAYPRAVPDDVYSSKLRAVMEGHSNLASVLRFRAAATPSLIAYTCIDAKGKEVGSWTWAGLHARAVQVVQVLRQRLGAGWAAGRGARVALVYRKYEMLDFVGSVFGCFYAGLCAVPVVAGDSYAELVHVLQSTGAALVLTTELNTKALHKDMAQNNVGPGWPTDVAWVRTDHLGGCVLSPVGVQSASSQFHARAAEALGLGAAPELQIDAIGADDLAYIEFSKSPNGELKGVQVTHGAIMRQCAVWMLSTGMLDVGRKYKHRVELDEGDYAQGPGEGDYAQGLGLDNDNDNDGDDGASASASAAEGYEQGLGDDVAAEKHAPPSSSSGRRWGSTSGFLGRLRNVGSLPKMRRGSRVSSIGGRERAGSNVSASAAPRQQAPSTVNAPSTPATSPGAAVGPPPDVVVSYIEPRQHFGLVFGVFGACYGGHQAVYVSSGVCAAAGAYINLLTRYRATVAVGDYAGLSAVLATATDEPAQIGGFSKKVAPSLASLRLWLVDTLFIDPGFHAAFDRNVLHRFGCPYQGIADAEGHPVVTPVCTLAEHGSVLMAMRDCLGAGSGAAHEFVLDRAAFRANRVVVLPDERGEAEVDRVGTVRFPVFGLPALGATVAVVDPETRELCAADAIGELWLSSPSLGSGFWGLPKLSASIFGARFTQAGAGAGAEAETDGPALSSGSFLRTGLMGALVQGRVLVFGFYEDRIRTLTNGAADDGVTGEVAATAAGPTLSFHYAGDINATIRRYLPQVSECTAFEMFANDTHFPVIAAEVRHNSGAYAAVADEIYAVLRARHALHAYAVALCPPGSLPRAFQYGKRTVNAQLCRHQFESGRVNCLYVRLSTDRLFVNLPPARGGQGERSYGDYDNYDDDDDALAAMDPSVARYGRWLQQTSVEPGAGATANANAQPSHASITELLVWRAAACPDHVAFTQFDKAARPLKPMTFAKLLAKVAAVAQLMLDRRRVAPGDHVLVAIAPSPSLAVAVHACLAIGAVPIVVAPPDAERLADDLPPLLVTAREFGVSVVLVDALSEDVFRGKQMDAALRVPALRALLGPTHRMPAPLCVAKAPKAPRPAALRLDPQWARDPARAALVMLFAGAQASTPQYVSYSHRALLGFCEQQRGDFQMLPELPVIASVRAYSGYGLLHCTMVGIYVGCTTLLLAPVDFFAAPPVWFDLVQRYRIKDAFATLPMLQHAMNYLAAYPAQHRFDLRAVRNLIVATEERVDPLTYASIRDFFAPYGLSDTAINPLYGTLMNPCISTRAYLAVSPLTLRLDAHAMRRARVVALAEPQHDGNGDGDGDLHHHQHYPDSLTLQDSGKVSGSTGVAIVDPTTRQPLPAGCIGEVWVCSDSNAIRKQTPVIQPAANGRASQQLPRPLMTITDSTGYLDSNSGNSNVFVRTGDLGFLYLQVDSAPDGGNVDDSAPAEPYLFVAGRIAETFHVDGYMHFYSDLERAVEEPCEDIVQGSCVVIQTALHAAPPPASAANDSPPLVVDPSSPPRLVAVISLRRAPSDSFLPNAACLIFNNVLDRHQVLLDEIVFVPRDALPRSRISERRRRTVRGLYESGKLNAFVSYPIANSPPALGLNNRCSSFPAAAAFTQ